MEIKTEEITSLLKQQLDGYKIDIEGKGDSVSSQEEE